jgi:hypothetical protein
MATSRPKSSAFDSGESLKAALEKLGAQPTLAGQSGALAAALRKVSEGTNPPPNTTLKAALEKLGAQPTLAGQSGALAAALRKVSENANHPLNPSLKAALGRSADQGHPSQQEDPLRAVKKWSEAYSHSDGETFPHFRGGLKGICKGVEAGPKARTLGFRDGLLGSMHLGLDARLTPRDLAEITANEALAGDWRRTERDLWASIERVTRQLEELPEPTQSRLRSALIRRLRSGEHYG